MDQSAIPFKVTIYHVLSSDWPASYDTIWRLVHQDMHIGAHISTFPSALPNFCASPFLWWWSDKDNCFSGRWNAISHLSLTSNHKTSKKVTILMTKKYEIISTFKRTFFFSKNFRSEESFRRFKCIILF